MRASKTTEGKSLPSKVKVGKRWYTVVRVETMGNIRGEVDYVKRSITIAARSSGYGYTSDDQYNTFLHELTHAILRDMRNPLAYDEKFVTRFSNLLDAALDSVQH